MKSCFLRTYPVNIVFAVLAVLAFEHRSHAQNITQYNFTSTSGSFTAIDGISPALSTGSVDDGAFNNLPIGFDFWFMGERHTRISASTNGLIAFGTTVANDYQNDLTNGGTRPHIAPLWDDLNLVAATNFSYLTTGTAGNRILTLEFLNVKWNYNAWGAVISFQVKLHESTGKIEMIYRQQMMGVSSGSASIGIAATAKGAGNFLSVSNAGTSVSSTTEASVSTKPATGRTYSFTPPVPAAPTGLSFTNVSGSTMTLNWSDNSNNETGFAIYRSTDGVNYTFVSQTAANTTSSPQTDLTQNITYYWRVFAVSEGALSAALAGSRVTLCSGPSISQLPSTGLISYHKFEGNANDALDNNNGTLQNAPAVTADRYGNNTAYSFNGVNQYISTNNAYVNPSTVSVSAWFKTSATTGGVLAGFSSMRTGNGGNRDRFIYMTSGGQLYFGVAPGAVKRYISTTASFNDGHWHMATGTVGAGGLKLYVDGVLLASDPTVTSSEVYTGYWRFGHDDISTWPEAPASHYFEGTIDDVIVHHRELSASEIGILFTAPDGAGSNSPVCVGGTLNLTARSAAGAIYSWTGPNGFTSSLQNPTIVYTTAAQGVYKLEVRSAGCSTPTVAYVRVTGSNAPGQWTGNVSTDWANPANWCSGVLPTATTDVTISATATRMPTIATSVDVNNLTIAAGASLTLSATGTLNISGTLTNAGTISNSGTTRFNGTSGQQTYSGISQFHHIVVANPAGIAIATPVTINGNLTINTGIVSSNNFNISIKGNWINNATATSFNAGTATVSFNGSTVQTIGGTSSTTFNHLTAASTGSTVTLLNNVNVSGNLSVTSGTFNLSTFNANRAAAGGILLVSNNATLSIGGTQSFPANYTTNTLVTASNVEYAGTNQTVSNQLYGNLILTGSAGAAVKTFAAGAMTIEGNLISSSGAATSVSVVPAADVTINGNVTIGTATTLSGSSYIYNIGGNWTNNGTFAGNSGTVVFKGTGTTVTGTGVQGFNNLTIVASMVSFTSNNVTVSGNLSTTGSGSFSQATGGTLTMTGSGKTISGTGITLNNLNVPGNVSIASSLALAGDLNIPGSFTASAGTVTMSGSSKSILGAGTKNFSTLFVTGSVTTAVNFNISSGLSVVGAFSATGGIASFSGTSTLSGTANLSAVLLNGTKLQLTANSELGIGSSLAIAAGSLDVTTSTPNTVNFNGTGAQNINGIDYNRLILSNGGNKTASAAITVNDDFTIGSGTTFTSGNFIHSIYKNWTNNGSFTAGSGTIRFTGTATSNIIGATSFNNLTLDHATDAASVILQSYVSAVVVNITRGKLLTGTNTVTITSTRNGNGIILGNIRRTHAFAPGVAYAFESPYNTITFASVTGVSDVTVSVSTNNTTDFPNSASIHREYNVVIPSGTYNATLQLHYEDDELHGNQEENMGLWRYNIPTWTPVGKTANNTSLNYVEQTGLTNVNGRWTLSDNSNVVQWNGSISSDWNTPGNWTVVEGSASRPPGPLDIVLLGNAAFTNQPTINTAVSVKKIAFASTKAVSLTLAAGGSLTTAGTIDGTWDKNMMHIINVNDQTLTVNDLNLGDNLNGRGIHLNLGSGVITTLDGIRQSGGANITVTGTGTIRIFEDYEYVSGIFTAGNGTVEYNGVLNQAIGPVIYNNLTINKPTGIALINSATTINGNLQVSSGELLNQVNTIIKGNVTIAPQGTFQNESVLHVSGNWTNNGNYISGPGSVYLNGPGTQNISNTTFETLIIEKPVGSSVVLGSDIALKGSLLISSGSLNVVTYSCGRLTMGGAFNLGDSATYITAGNSPPLNFTTYTVSPSSTVIYNGTTPQVINIEGITLGHAIFRNAGQKTLASGIAIGGDLTIESGSNLNAGTNTIRLGGNWKNSGTFNQGTGTVLFNGTGKTINGNTTFHTAIIAGSYTQLANITYDNLLHITQSGAISSGTGIFTTMNGDLMNLGSLITHGTTTYSGLRVQKLSLINSTTFALIVNFNGSVSPILNSTSVPQFGYININNTGGLKPSVDWTIAYNMTVGTGASFHGGNSVHTMMGSVINNGTITSEGTINFVPSTAATINFGSHFSSTGLLNFGGTGAITVQGTPEAMHDVVISNQHVTGVSPSSSWTVDSNFTVENNAVFNAGSATYTVGGNLVNTGTINAGSSTFILNGSVQQRVSSSSALNNVTMNKTGGNALLFRDLTINNTLHFISGTITTGTYKVILPATGSINGAGQPRGWINGNLQKHISAGATSFSYEVGDQTNYTPATISFSNVSIAGQLTVKAVPAQHPNGSGSVINDFKNVNRYWSLVNAGIVFDEYAATLKFKPSDVDAGAIPLNFGIDVYSGSSWSLPTIGNRTDTSTQATGISRIGDIAIGEICNAGTTITYNGSPYCLSSGIATVSLSGTTGGIFTASGGLNINPVTGEILLSNSNAGTFTITYTVAATASCPIYTTTATVVITKPTEANILYEASPYFAGSTVMAVVTFSGTEGGKFGSTTGLVIDSLTGAINVSLSTAGSYTVTYTLEAVGGCAPVTATANVVIISKKTWDGGAGTTNWGDANNWNPNAVPLASEDIELDGAFIIDVNVAGFTKSLTLNHPLLVLTMKTGNTISVAGNLNVLSGTFNTETNLPAVTGSTSITGGTIGYTGTGTQTIAPLNYNNLTSSSSGTRILSNSGVIGIRGQFAPGANSYVITGSTVDFNGATGQLIPAINYYNLIVSNAGVKTVMPGTAGVAGILSVNGSATLNTSDAAATISYNGNQAQNVTPISYYALNISSDDMVRISSAISVPKFSITKGTFDLNTFSLTSTDTAMYNGGHVHNGPIQATGKWASFNETNINAPITVNCANLYLSKSTFNGVTHLSKNGPGLNTSGGGNTYNGITVITNSGSGSLDLANTDPEIFNANLTINNTGASRIQIGISSENNVFNGNVTINHGGNTVSNNTIISRNASASAVFNGNLILNCTNQNTSSGIIIANDGRITVNGNIIVSSTNGRGILFGAATGTVTITDGFTISDDGAGMFTTGTLTLNKFIQSGNTAQTIRLTGTANLLIGTGSKFEGAVNFTAPELFLTDAQFNGAGVFTKTGGANNVTVGGNTFGGPALIRNTGSGFFRLANTKGDNFKSNATFVQLGAGLLQPAYKGTTSVAGHLSTEGTLSEIGFGSGGGTVMMNGTVKQNIEGTISPRFNNLRIENAGDTVAPKVNLIIDAHMTVASGVLNLGVFTADRSTAGGLLTLANGGKLRIGGTNTIPANYNTHDIGATSTVDYAGVNQIVAALNSSQLYGHLTISGTGATVNADLLVRNNLNVPGSFDIKTFNVKVGGALTSSGNFTVSEGAVEMNGSNAQLIPAGVFTGNVIKELRINNVTNVTLAGSLNVKDVLHVYNGQFNTGGHLILRSTATGTARVAEITSAAAQPIVGNVLTERYIPGKRKYRLLTSSVSTSSGNTLSPGQEHLSIWGNWQNQGNNVTGNNGTLITGGTSADGYDTQTGNPSLFTYDDVNRAYRRFSSTNGNTTKYTPLKAGVAYYMFVYGDRLNTVSTSNPNNTTLRSYGTLLTGDQVYTPSSENPLSNVPERYTMIGNPFASPIDWASLPKTNVSNTYWGWDPNLSNTGGYVTVSTAGSVTIIAPFSGSTGLDQYIQPGQGFFVKTTAPSPTLIIRERDKVANFNPHAFSMVQTLGARTVKKVSLMAVNLQYNNGATKVLADGVVAAFDQGFSAAVNDQDAAKMMNTAEAISILNGNAVLSIDARPVPVNNDTVKLQMARITKSQYTLQIFSQQMETSGLQPYLEDNFLNTSQLLSVKDTNYISFSVTAVAASSAPDRFQIVFRAPLVLATKFVSAKAVAKNSDVEVDWKVADDKGHEMYEVQRSTDGNNFTTVVRVNSNATGQYKWLDESVTSNIIYYRIRAVNQGGDNIFSKTMTVKLVGENPSVRIFPIPVTGYRMNLEINDVQKRSYQLRLSGTQGQIVMIKHIEHTGGKTAYQIIIDRSLKPGVYFAKIYSAATDTIHKIIIE